MAGPPARTVGKIDVKRAPKKKTNLHPKGGGSRDLLWYALTLWDGAAGLLRIRTNVSYFGSDVKRWDLKFTQGSYSEAFRPSLALQMTGGL
jgi:hypothetical protein